MDSRREILYKMFSSGIVQIFRLHSRQISDLDKGVL